MKTPAKKSNKPEARLMGTLVYLDEPQVVLLEHGPDARIIGVAIDKEGYDYGFLGAEISFNQLVNYLRELVDLRNLFLVPRYRSWYLFDLALTNENQIVPLKRATKEDYQNEEFLPAPQFFARNHTEELVELPTAELVKQKYLIDGTWSPQDLSIFFARINDLYSFFLGIKKFQSSVTSLDQKKQFIRAFSDHPLRGGSSYVGLYGDLKGLLGFEERLAMGAIKKESPGYLDIEGKSEVLSEITSALCVYSQNAEEITAHYKQLHSFLSKMKLLKAEPDRFDPTSPVAGRIKELSKHFATLLNVDYTAIETLTGKHILLSAKILLSHYRRIERYNLFFIEGRVQFPEEDYAEFFVEPPQGVQEHLVQTLPKLLPPQET